MPRPTEVRHFVVIERTPPHGTTPIIEVTPLNEEALKALLVEAKVPERFWRVGYYSGFARAYHFSPIVRNRPTDIGPGSSAINDCGG
jgi:hypothetical protein